MHNPNKCLTFAVINSATPLSNAYQGGTFAIYIMDYTKQPLDYPQILQMLKNRGLIVKDEIEALRQLKIISYFRLANYMSPMEVDKDAHLFKPDSLFENAVDLYYFDKQLRVLLFTAVQSVEIALRSKIIHYLSMRYGAFWFMDENLSDNKSLFAENLSHINKELKRSREDFISAHFAKYTSPQFPPVWKTLEVVSFGTLSKLLENFNDKHVKKAIAKDFNLPQHLYLESWVKSIAVLRNCIAHHSRIWNRRFPLKPQLPQRLNGKWVDCSKICSAKLYAQLCCLAYLQNHIHPSNDFTLQLKSLLQSHPNVDVAAMGFPVGWENDPLWK